MSMFYQIIYKIYCVELYLTDKINDLPTFLSATMTWSGNSVVTEGIGTLFGTGSRGWDFLFLFFLPVGLLLGPCLLCCFLTHLKTQRRCLLSLAPEALRNNTETCF